MRTRQHRKQSDLFNIQSFNSIRDQLEQQNANLLRERQMIQQQLQPTQGHPRNNNSFGGQTGKFQQDYSPIHGNTSPYNSPSQKNVVGTLKYKISQIIDLCQGHSGNSQFNEVAQAERQILGFLQTLPNAQIKNHFQSSSQRHSKRKKAKLNKTQVYDHHKDGFRNMLGDEAMELIEQIQRKALLQIENLRNDKISLMKRLNQQIKALNEQKRLRIIHQRKLQSQMDVVNEQSEQNQSNIPNQNYQRQIENQPPRKRQNQTRIPSNFQPSSNVQTQTQKINQNQNIQQKEKYVPAQSPNAPSNNNYTPINSAVSPKNQFNQNYNSNHIHNVPAIPNGSAVQYPIVQYPPKASNVAPNTQNPQYTPTAPRGQFKSPQQVTQEMDRIRHQNQKMRHFLNTNNVNPNIKNQLRSELAQLESKIQQYEQALAKSKKSKAFFDFEQFQNLMNQANYITQEGQKILKIKRSPIDNRTTVGSYGYDQARFSAPLVPDETQRGRTGKFQEINEDRSNYSRPPLQTFSPMDKSYHSNNYKSGSGFSPTVYEKLIEEMNHLTKI